MINDIGDIVLDRHHNLLCMIVDVESKNGQHMFQLYNLITGGCNAWFEPFDQVLSSNYWETLG